MLGEGKVDWPEFFAALDAVGYSGALSIEFEAYSYYKQVLGSDPSAAAVLAAEQARALIGGGSR
jgi:sugar phosphate isomerase/epimerase